MSDGTQNNDETSSLNERGRETIEVDGERFTREELTERIRKMIEEGDTRNARFTMLANALDNLDARLMVKSEEKIEVAYRYLKDNEMILDTTYPIEERIEEARRYLTEKKYEGSLGKSRAAFDLIDEQRRRHVAEINRLFDDVDELIRRNKDMGVDVSDGETVLYNGRYLLERSEYEEAVKLGKMAKERLLESRESFMDEKLRREELGKSLKEAERYIAENEELGVSTGQAEGLFFKAKYLLEKREYDRTEEAVEELNDRAKEARRRFQKAKASEVIGEFEGVRDKYEDLELKTVEIDESMEEVRDLFEEGAYVECREMAEGCVKDLKELIDGKYRELVAENRKGVGALIEEGRELGVDTEGLTEEFTTADALIDKKEYEKALSLSDDIWADAAEKVARKKREIYAGKMKDLEGELNDLEEKTEEEYGDLKELLTKADKAREDEDFSLFDNIAHEFREGKEEHHREYLRWEYERKAKEAEEEISYLSELGLDLEAEMETLEDFREGIEAGEFEVVREKMERLTETLEAAKSEKGKARARNLLKTTSRELTNLKRAGADVKDVNARLRGVLTALRKKSYIKGIELALDTRREMGRVRKDFYREKCSKTKATIEKAMEEGAELGLDIEELKQDLERAARLFAEEEYKMAFGNLREIKESYTEARRIFFKERSARSLEELDDLLKRAGGLQLDVNEFLDRRKAVESGYNKGRFESAAKKVEKGIELLRSAIETRLRELVSQGKDELDLAFARAEELGVDTTEEKEYLGEVEKPEDATELERALEILDECKMNVDEKISVKLREINALKLEEARQELLELEEETGEEYGELGSLLEKGGETLEDENYAELDEFLEAFEEKRRERYNEYRAERYRGRLKDAVGTLNRISALGIDMSDGEALPPVIEEGLSRFDFDTVEQKIELLEGAVNEARKSRVKKVAKEHFIRIKGLIGELKGEGVTIDEENEIFGNAIRAIKGGGLLEGCELGVRAEERLSELREEHYRKRAQRELANAEEFLVEGKELGLDIGPVNDLVTEAKEALEGKKYLESIDRTAMAVDTFESAKREYFDRKATAALQKLEDRKEEGIELGLDMDRIEEGILIARGSYTEGNYEKAIETAGYVKADYSEMREGYYREAAQKELEELDHKVAEGLELGIDMEDIGVILDRARELMRDGDFERVIETAGEGEEKYSSRRSDHYREKLEDLRQILDELKEEAEELEIDLKETESGLEEVGSLYEKGDFERGYRAGEELEDRLLRDIEEELTEILTNKISEVGETVERAEGMGVGTSDDEEALGDISKMKAEGMFREGIEKADECLESLNARIRDRRRDLYEEKLNTVAGLLTALKNETDRSYEELEEIAGSAREAWADEDYESQDSLLQELRDGITEERRLYRREEYIGDLERMLERCGDLEAVGLEVGEIMPKLENAREFVGEFEFERADEYLTAAKDELKEAETLRAKKKAREHFVRIKELLTELKGFGLNLKEEEAALREGIAAVKAQDFVEACGILLEAYRRLEEREEEYYREKASEEIEELRHRTDELENLNVETEEIKSLYDKAVSGFENKEFKGSLNKAVAGNKIATEARNTHFMNETAREVRRGEELIGEAVELGVDTKEVETALEEVRGISEKEAFKDGFVRAKEIAEHTEGLIEEKLSEMLGSRRRELAGMLKEAEELGIDTTRSAEVISSVDEFKEEDRYREALELLGNEEKKLGEMIAERTKEINREKIEKAEEELEELEEETGGSFDDLHSMLFTAKENFQEAEYEKLEDGLDLFRTQKREYYDEHLTEMYGERCDELEERTERLRGLNVDVARIEELIETAREGIAATNFDAVKGDLEEVETALDEVRTVEVKERAKEHFVTVKGLIGELKGEGVDLSGENETFKEAVEAIKGGDLVRGCELAIRAEEDLREARRRYYSERVEETIEEIGRLRNRAGELGLDIAEWDEVDTQCRVPLEEGRYEEALSAAENAKGDLSAAINAKNQGILEGKIEELFVTVEEAKELGLDTDSAEQTVEQVRDLAEEGRLEEAIDLADDLKRSLSAEILEREMRHMGKLLENSRAELRAFTEETGEEYSDLESYLELAAMDLEERDVEEAREQLSKYREAREEYERAARLRRYEEKLRNMRDTVEKLGGLGIEVGDAESGIYRLERLLSDRNADGAREGLAELSDIIEDAENARAKELASRRIADSKSLFKELKSAGVDLKEEEKMFKGVIGYLQSENYVNACGSISEAIERLKARKEEYLTDKALSAVGRARETAGKLSELDLPAAHVEELAEEAERMIDAGEPVKAEEIARSGIEEGNTLLDDHHIDKVGELLDELEARFEEEGIPDMDLSPVERVLDDAYDALDGRDHASARKKAEEARELFERNKTALLRERTGASLEEAMALLARAKESGVDTVSVEPLLTYARVDLEDEDFDSSRKVIEQVKNTLRDMMNGSE